MKRLVGAFIVVSTIGIGAYYYLSSPSDIRVESSKSAAPATANISTPLQEEASTTNKKEEIKKLPDLDSLKGLEQESSDLFNGAQGLPDQTNSNPLEGASQ